MPISPAIQPLVTSVIRSVIAALNRSRFIYNFDGADDYGVLDDRAVNIESDNYLAFWSPSLAGVTQNIITQNISNSESLREFQLIHTSVNALSLTYGGAVTTLLTSAQGYKNSTRYQLSLIGNNFTVYENDTAVRSGAFTRGTAREPAAKTVICARANGSGGYTQLFQGPQYDIVINGRSWPMSSKGEAVQPSIPAGNNMTLVNSNHDRWIEVQQ